MRYRYHGRRYTMIVSSGATALGAGAWRLQRVSAFLAPPAWRPDTDVYETASALVVTVDIAGADEEDVEVLLFEDAIVIDGQRRLPPCEDDAVYHAAAIRQGPFRVEITLPGAVDHEHVDARVERGLLRVTLPKAGER